MFLDVFTHFEYNGVFFFGIFGVGKKLDVVFQLKDFGLHFLDFAGQEDFFAFQFARVVRIRQLIHAVGETHHVAFFFAEA